MIGLLASGDNILMGVSDRPYEEIKKENDVPLPSDPFLPALTPTESLD